MTAPGRIVILNGPPRSGKSLIAAALQARPGSRWIALGVDAQVAALPPALRPGIGLRPGGERPDLEATVVALYTALFDTIAAHARLDFDVVTDLGLHEDHSKPLGIRALMAERLANLPVFLIGIDCSDAINQSRRASNPGTYSTDPAIIARWREAVHAGMPYDLRLDAGTLTPEACARYIDDFIATNPVLGLL